MERIAFSMKEGLCVCQRVLDVDGGSCLNGAYSVQYERRVCVFVSGCWMWMEGPV